MADTNLPESQRYDPYAHGISHGHSDLYSFFMGPPPRPGKESAYSKKPTAKWNMPESYIGESEFLRDTVEDWNFTANQTWYTERILPWYRTDEIHVHWEQWENNPSFMEQTPHQAASHIVTQMRSIRRATLIRRGIGAEFEHDFVKTALGRTSFIASLAQIGRSFQETANVEVIRALLGCHRSTQIFVRKYQIVRDGDLDAWLDRKAARFMIAQKEDFGLEKLNVAIEAEQEKYQASANCWILGREVVDYCQVVDPNRTLYYLGGQEAVNRINGRPAGGQAAAGTMGNVRSLQPDAMIGVQGVPVYLAKSYVVDSLGQLDLLSRTTEVGVFNTQIDRTTDYSKYTSESRNIRVYDNTVDDWAELTQHDAIDKNIVWATDGKVDNPFSSTRGPFSYDKDFLRIPGDNTDDVRYIGDIDSEYLPSKTIFGAAQTILNALQRLQPTALTTALDALGARSFEKDATGVVGTSSSGKSTGIADDMNVFEAALRGLLGESNLFFTGAAPSAKGSTSTTELWKFFMGKYGAKKGTAVNLTAVESSIGGNQEDSHTKFLTEVLGAPVPASHKDEFNRIVAQKDQSWEARADQIQALLVGALQEDPSSVPSLGTEARVKGWIKLRKEGYEAKLVEMSESARRTGASSSSSSSRNVEANVEYFPIGTPLPDGYQYLNEREAARARNGNVFPKSLADFDFLSHLFGGEQASMGGIRSIGGPIGERRPTGRFDGRGGDGSKTRFEQDRRGSRFNTLDTHIKNISASGVSLIHKWLAIFYLGSEFSKQQFLSFDTNNILVPVNFLHIRHMCGYRTRYGIKCASGGKSGYTFFGHSDMQIAHDVTRKVGVMHYTAYLAAVVTNPKNVYVVEDLFCEKYLGGMGTKFWTRNEYLSKGSHRYKADIVCTMLPASCKRLDKKIDIRGKFYSEFAMKLVDPTRMSDMCYPGAARTAAYMDWWDPIKGSRVADKEMRVRTQYANWICWQGVQWHFNTTAGGYVSTDMIVEQGNFGPNVYPGCGRVRNGESKFLTNAPYLGGASQGRF